MLEIFLRDRDIDYDMFVYHNEKFHYITKEKNKKNNALYCGLSTGTIILDGVVLNNTLTNLEQINYIKEILNSFADIVDAYRKKYEPAYVKYTFGESIGDIIINGRIIEVPNRYQFHEWIYINAYDYLEKFVCEFERQKYPKSLKRKKLNFFNRN